MQPSIAASIYASIQAFTRKDERRQSHSRLGKKKSEGASKKPANRQMPQLADEGSEASDTQDAHMKDVSSCEKCGHIFLRNQQHHKWEHKCTGSVESAEHDAKPALSVAMTKFLQHPTQSGFTESSTTNRSSGKDTESAATDEDAPSCEKCGHAFSRKEIHLLSSHTCEPTEVTHTPDPPQQLATSSESNQTKPVLAHVADMQQLVDEGSAASDTQEAHKREHKYIGSAESGERVAQPAPLAAKPKILPRPKALKVTRSSTRSRSSEKDAESAATDEDAPSCKRCGRKFSRKELHLLSSHKCEPTEVTHTPDPPQQLATSSESNQTKPVLAHVADMQQLVDEGSAASDTQEAHKQEHNYIGSAESGERVAKSAPLASKPKLLPRPTQLGATGSSTTSRSGETDTGTESAASNEDASRCGKCGQTFSRKELHLLSSHTCEPTEVTHTPDPPQQLATSSESNQSRPVPAHAADMQQLVDEGSATSETQDAYEMEHKFTGSAESGVHIAKPGPSDAEWKCAQSGYTRSRTMGSVSGIVPAAADEDAPKCEKCGRTFPWNQLHLRWKHKCEPAEVTHTQDHSLRQTQPSVLNKPLYENLERLLSSSTVEHRVQNEADRINAPHVYGRSRTLSNNEREFMTHSNSFQHPEGVPKGPPGAGRKARRVTVPRK